MHFQNCGVKDIGKYLSVERKRKVFYMDTAVSEEFISNVTEGKIHYCQIAIFIRALPT